MSETKQKAPYPLRMPDPMREKLQEAAHQNHRSMNAEIVARLEESFKADTASSVKGFGQMTAHEFLEKQRVTLKQHLEEIERLQKGEE